MQFQQLSYKYCIIYHFCKNNIKNFVYSNTLMPRFTMPLFTKIHIYERFHFVPKLTTWNNFTKDLNFPTVPNSKETMSTLPAHQHSFLHFLLCFILSFISNEISNSYQLFIFIFIGVVDFEVHSHE